MPSEWPSINQQLHAASYKGESTALADLTRPLLDAVVKVDGDTGNFVSEQGLALTHHHVAFGVIEYNSNAQRNLIENGFMAANRSDERSANADFRLRVTVGFDRIVDEVLDHARGRTGRTYYDAVDAAGRALVAECEHEAGMHCSGADMFCGRDFYLLKQLELRDVWLVYAPPPAIGNYGDEVDNFMWSRRGAILPCCAPMSGRTASRRITRRTTGRTRRSRICRSSAKA